VLVPAGRTVPEVDTISVAYIDEGPRDGTAVVMLHGEPTWGYLYRHMVRDLIDRGYRVLVPDQVGFGRSDQPCARSAYTYAAHVAWIGAWWDAVDSAQFEGRDVRRMISWVARQPGVAVDRAGDPRLGMVGGSYGGGIQFVTAATDCRVDAIAPIIAWNSLVTSLGKARTPKAGWSAILMAASAGGRVDPRVTAANDHQLETGTVSDASLRFFASRGPGPLLRRIEQPTLIIQGTVDDLFTPTEAVRNYEILRENGTTVSMAWYCGGHGTCLTDPGSIDPGGLSVAWMDRYVKGERSAPVLRGFEFVDQDGRVLAARAYPPKAGPRVTARGSGTLALQQAGGSGPPAVRPSGTGVNAVVDGLAWRITPGPAANALNVPIAFDADTVVVGAPRLTLAYTGTAASTGECTRLERVFAQLLDTRTGIVVGNQITPIPVRLDGRPRSISVPLEAVGYSATVNSRLSLQIVANSNAYAEPCFGGTLEVGRVSISLPTAVGMRTVTAD
jgi:ABC-2 type transport system ATP-binding protein